MLCWSIVSCMGSNKAWPKPRMALFRALKVISNEHPWQFYVRVPPPQHPGSKMFQAPQFSSLCKYKQIIGVAFDKT